MVNDFELLTTFAERFVLPDWWSLESVSTHCNLLVFYGYLLLSLLLYLHIAASCLFELTTITSVKHSTKSCKERQVYLFFYCWPFSSQCFVNWMAGFCMRLALAWNRPSIYLYWLITLNMLSSNRRFVLFLLQTVLERNQVLNLCI